MLIFLFSLVQWLYLLLLKIENWSFWTNKPYKILNQIMLGALTEYFGSTVNDTVLL